MRSRRGLVFVSAAPHAPGFQAQSHGGGARAALDGALDDIAARYGAVTEDFVALQLEYDRGD